jgi:hypothetical protein
MRKDTLKDKKNKLKIAITRALITANEEMKVLKKNYKEENLRYSVMHEISNVDCFGVFPNIDENRQHNLCFEHYYQYEGIKKDFELRPDIVSLKKKPSGYSVNSPLAIELKQNGKITNNKVRRPLDLKEQINKLGSCIESDILKSRIYLLKKDSFTFDISVVIHLVSEDCATKFSVLEKMLNRQRDQLICSSKSNKNLLFAWFNQSTKKPELIWLNQKNKIVLAKKP